ncbi:MAG: hypothetical protein ACPIOQ_83870, partial [Promethearchaeia archaeon]
LHTGQVDLSLCKEMAHCLRDAGIVVIRDPRVTADEATAFTELMQRYYSQEKSELMKDARPECAYQVGVTPENIECAKCAKDPKCLQTIDQMPAEHRPHKPTSPDPKWRFFWRIGPRPAKSAFPEQNLEPVVPAAFPEWRETMDAWGAKMLAALETTTELLAIGLGLERYGLARTDLVRALLLSCKSSSQIQHRITNMSRRLSADNPIKRARLRLENEGQLV